MLKRKLAAATDEQVQPESVQEVNRLTQYLCWDDMYGPTPGTKVVVQLYDAIALPQGSGWSEVNRQKWSFVQRERPLSFDEYVSATAFRTSVTSES